MRLTLSLFRYIGKILLKVSRLYIYGPVTVPLLYVRDQQTWPSAKPTIPCFVN